MDFTSKADNLQNELALLTPVEHNYEDYISQFYEEMTYIFTVNKNNVDIAKLKDIIAKCGFYILDVEPDRQSHLVHFRVKEV